MQCIIVYVFGHLEFYTQHRAYVLICQTGAAARITETMQKLGFNHRPIRFNGIIFAIQFNKKGQETYPVDVAAGIAARK